MATAEANKVPLRDAPCELCASASASPNPIRSCVQYVEISAGKRRGTRHIRWRSSTSLYSPSPSHTDYIIHYTTRTRDSSSSSNNARESQFCHRVKEEEEEERCHRQHRCCCCCCCCCCSYRFNQSRGFAWKRDNIASGETHERLHPRALLRLIYIFIYRRWVFMCTLTHAEQRVAAAVGRRRKRVLKEQSSSSSSSSKGDVQRLEIRFLLCCCCCWAHQCL